MTSAERTTSEAGWGACRRVVVDGGRKDWTWASIRYCLARGYEVVSWACQSWTVACCHTLGMSWQDFFLVAVFHHAI